MSELVAPTEFDLDSLLGNIGKIPEKKLLYGTAGSGKSVSAVSAIIPYLIEDWTILFVFTENNALKGFQEGLRIYIEFLKPWIKPDSIWIADLTTKIAEKNKDNVGSVKSAENALLTLGGVYETCKFFTDSPEAYSLTSGNKTVKKFKGKNNLTTLVPEDKVLIILDGYTALDNDTGGFAHWMQSKPKISNNAAFWGGLRGSGTNALQMLIAQINTDLIVMAHDKTKSIDLTDMLSGDKKEEAQARRDVLDEQMLDSVGYPSLGTSTTVSKLLGVFTMVLHAKDTRVASNNKIPRFQYDLPAAKNSWYTRLPKSLDYIIKKHAGAANCLSFLPQDYTHVIHLTYLLKEGKLSEENYHKLLTQTKQKPL